MPYESLPDLGTATWFIDPPYTGAGKHYKFGVGGLDHNHLAEWCRSRDGQVIVCESGSARWLPFEPVGLVRSTRKTTGTENGMSRESVWIKDA